MKVLVIGGNRYFGKRLVQNMISVGAKVSVLNRGSKTIEGANNLQCDRTDSTALRDAVKNQSWDIIFDQACYDAEQASHAAEIFKGNVGRYIFTSSMSVYDSGAAIKESVFDPANHPFDSSFLNIARYDTNYGEAKRQAEAAFTQKVTFPLVSVRFPIVLGPDDYTGRLKFHIDRIKNGEPIYFPSLGIRMSFVHSQDAAEALYTLGKSDFKGPLNVASADPIRLEKMMQTIEQTFGKKMIVAQEESKQNHSPFGIEADWWMDTSKLRALGIFPRPIENWLGVVCKEIAAH
jgi:nucleoside-diphosphate-sugar epimerase